MRSPWKNAARGPPEHRDKRRVVSYVLIRYSSNWELWTVREGHEGPHGLQGQGGARVSSREKREGQAQSAQSVSSALASHSCLAPGCLSTRGSMPDWARKGVLGSQS